MGIVETKKAIKIAEDRNLDLVQITKKTKPPVCKIIDYGKYLYSLQKKKQKQSQKGSEVKGVRLSFNISDHDLETKANLAQKFLENGDRAKIEMRLRGREKAHQDLAREKIKSFLEIIENEVPVKKEGKIKKEPRGLTLMITKK